MGSYNIIEAKPPASDELFEAQAHLYSHVYGYVNGLVLKCAVQLNIPEIIHNNNGHSITLPQLISKLDVHPTKSAYVERLVRFLVHNGFLKETLVAVNGEKDEEEGNKAYTLTPSSTLLVNGLEPNLTPMVLATFHNDVITSVNSLGRWFQGEEKTAFEIEFGVEIWDFLEGNPERMKSFNQAMACDSQMVDVGLRDCKFVFEGLETIVDVGGGTGTACRIISERYPNIKCTVFDLPHVVQNSSSSASNTNNLSYIGGNMFESIPPAHAVMLKWILHNWDDENCIKILSKCKEAISKRGEGGKVIIIDAVIKEKEDEKDVTQVKLLFDITMMTLLNAKERTEKEWNNLLLSAGFKHHKITPIFGFRSIIEAYP